MPPNKRKRDILDFDPNKSDSEDENFEPETDRPHRSHKRSRPGKGSKSASRRRGPAKYRGSDIDDDDEELSDSQQEDSFGDDDDEDEDEDEDGPINENTGRRMRKAATKQHNYAESSDDEADNVADSDDKDELVGDTPKKEAPRRSMVVKLQLGKTPNKASTQTGRRTTRAATAEAETDLVELSNSGRHAQPARGSASKSPEAASRNRSTRGGKGVKKAPPEPIEEATQETTSHGNDGAQDDDVDEPMKDEPQADAGEEDQKQDKDQEEDAELPEADAQAQDKLLETVEDDEDDDDEDDGPITRRTRTRGSLAGLIPSDNPAEEEETAEASGRLSRKSRLRSKKSLQEPSSDFEPGNDSGEENESEGKGEEAAEEDDDSTPNPRGRRSATAKGPAKRQRRESGDDYELLDQDELAEELEELRESSRARRRRKRSPSVLYEEVSRRRVRKPVDYAIKPLDQLLVEPEEDEDPAPTPARRGRRTGGANAWDRSLHTIAGPFGGIGGTGSVFGGPWGTGAAGGVESDSSDDEMVQRSGVAGPVGMTPTSAAAPGLLPSIAQAANPDGPNLAGLGGPAPNVGKVKNQKALADADPLGVDMNVDFSKVGGLQGHIDQLKEMVQLPLLYPELFLKFHVTPPRGVLFHGPPGTGKTLLARALANSVGIGGKKITFYMRKGADALSKWVGEAEKQLRLLFEEARRTQPSIIFFDEIDGLAPVRSSKQEQIHASIVSTLLALMDGMDGRGQVIVIGATNRPDNIDPALRRPGRFDREFYFPLPDVEGRKAILDIHTKDWGISDEFKFSLARDAKGYGGADLRALCTEAALNAIQRTYPQIYTAKDKLIVNPDKISIHMTDFSISKKKIVPSSERSTTSAAAPLPKSIQPLLRDQIEAIKLVLDDIMPRQKKVTALDEAMYEPYDDADFGFGREALHQEFERSRIFRPRLLICGIAGMGHNYVSSAVLHYLEGVHVQNFDLPTILGDGRPAEQTIVSLFTEVKRRKPSIIFIPNVDIWYQALEGTPLTTFLGILRSIPPTDPVMLLGTADCELSKLSTDLQRDLFGFSKKNTTEIAHTKKENRREYFSPVTAHIRRFPEEFPDPSSRKKRVLEDLPVAPPPPPKILTKEEIAAEWIRYRQLLNLMKVHLQPIMDQINRKYKKFRAPVVPQSQYQYLLDEQDPNYVQADITILPRPFEFAKDKEGVQGLRSTETGRFFYNLDIQTIEERLANGYYTKPLEFLKDVRALESDAKAIGDRERHLKASELLANVEVDVHDIDQKFKSQGVDWDVLYKTEQARRAEKEEKARKRRAMQSLVDVVQSDFSGEQSVPRLHTTEARFQVISPLSNGVGDGSNSHSLSNGASAPSRPLVEDVQMTDADAQPQAEKTSPMQPPSQWPHMTQQPLDISTRATTGGTTQFSQVSAVQSLPAGVSPSALANDASTTKTSDPSNRSSNWSTQVTTNGVHHEQQSPAENMPDTQPFANASQTPSSEEQWVHSQTHGLARGILQQPASSSQGSRNSGSQAGKSGNVPSMANILNDPSPEESSQSQAKSGGSSQQRVDVDLESANNFLEELTKRTSRCTVEQLEQIMRELMSEIWRTKGEANRVRVYSSVMGVFNEVMNDINSMQAMLQPSQ